MYIPISLLYAFICDELPLKFYGVSKITYDAQKSSGLGPQSVNMDGILSAGLFILSVVFNFLVWMFCIVIIIRHFARQGKSNKEATNPDK